MIPSSDLSYKPPCPHFGVCGGCSLQDLDPEHYKAYKKDLVLKALAKHQVPYDQLDDPIIYPAHSRRRINWKAIKTRQGITLGYHERRGHNIVDIHQCPLVVSEIEGLTSPLRTFLNQFLKPNQRAFIFITKSDVGLDVSIELDDHSQLTLEQLEQLSAFAHDQNLARISYRKNDRDEPITILRTPVVHYAQIAVETDPSGFLQASSLSDHIFADLVMKVLPQKAKRAVDLFCGRGTLTLPLSDRVKVDAFDADSSALGALKKASVKNNRSVNIYNRNLFSNPLLIKELKAYDYLTINPPRAGAYHQCREIAASHIPVVVMVSCNPSTFARDAKLLIEEGYRLERVIPVDQFLWSTHIELVGYFQY